MAAISDDEGSNHSGSDTGDDLRPGSKEVFDSSEEEDEDDEDQLREEGKGWIVDEDEDSNDDDAIKKKKRKHRRRKEKKRERDEERERKRKQQEEDNDLLDEDDLELLMENSGAKRPSQSSSSSKGQFKRLKRAATVNDEDDDESLSTAKSNSPASKASSKSSTSGGLQDFFSDDDEENDNDNASGVDSDTGVKSKHSSASSRSSKNSQVSHRTAMDELDDFIEEDEFSDMDDAQRELERQRRKQERLQPTTITGIDSDRVNELYDIFGDGEDYAWALENEEEEGAQDGYDADIGGVSGSRPKLQDIYEPEELKARMLTDSDKIIRDTDVPERYQEYRRLIKNYDISADEFEHEKQWVAYMLSLEKSMEYIPDSDFSDAVAKVLTFIVKQNLEVPFIHAHRRDFLLKTTVVGEGDDLQTQVDSLLTENDLWRIVQLDIDFHSLSEKRKRVVSLQTALKVDDDTLNHFIESANNIMDFQDINDYINFIYSEELKDLHSGKTAKPTLYEKIRNNRLYEMVRAIGIKAVDFAINVETGTQHQIPSDYDKSPTTLATELCADEYSLFAKPRQAIEATKNYFSEQLYNDMRMRKHLRSLAYMCTFAVDLTTQGKLKIDKNSPFADLKYSVGRDYNSFKAKPDFFLRLLKAEELGLIQIRFSYSHSDLLQMFSGFILSEGQSDISKEWNQFRTDALSLALKKLWPLIQLNLKEELRRDCESLLFAEVRARFVSKLDQEPYQVRNLNQPKGTVPRVFAITPGNGKFGADAIIACLLESSGKVVDTYKFIENPIRKTSATGTESMFADRFLEVIAEARPDIVVINGFNAQTNKLYGIIAELLETNNIMVHPRDEDGILDEGAPGVPLEVIYVNDEVASRYQHSQRAKEEFPDKSILARYVIALARYTQSPLLEYVNLKEDVVSLSIHPHQSLLPEEKLRDAIVSSFVDIVNMVGVDINQCVSNAYLAAMLPYVAGLGERKSAGLLKAVQQHPLFSRQALITNPSIRIGSVVFLNCSSFLRIPQHKSSSMRAREEAMELLTPLDDTRIHPEDYALAEKMAGDALELDEEELEELKNSESGETVIDRLFAQRDYTRLLNSLILEEYSRQLEEDFGKKKRATLQLILEELQDPYLDIRASFRMMNSEEIFENLTGETPSTLFIGAVVPIKVRSMGKYDVSGFTASQIFAKTEDRKARESEDMRDLSVIYSMGQSVAAKVMTIDYQRFQITISLLKEDISNPVQSLSFDKSQYWDLQRELADMEEEKSKERHIANQTRLIQHVKFKNINARDAETDLSHREDGECVIRPSSKGPDHIAITWKVAQNLYQHVDVVEKIDNQYGKYYIIGKDSFSDLDEIIHSYIGEMSKNVRAMSTHEKFRDGTRDEVASRLNAFYNANPKKACYAFAWNHKRPGWFLLMYKLNPKMRVESWNVKADAKGFILNHYNYPDMVALCNGFKTLVMNQSNANRARAQGAGNRSQYQGQAGGDRSQYQGQGQGQGPAGGDRSQYQSYGQQYAANY
ncbi:hypothetical protein WICPIJ_001006 [Wickerhamomyces pijperi]|uniref:Transcription elongation factor Spt6 n=1 Tax=Wickerhamomyces pijperi TaxID=599730 RepID=A0A9P8QCF1_WICPI|nr:hypothetical protein WICPIJ_001006 [Wickerhamomyces pijperi]